MLLLKPLILTAKHLIVTEAPANKKYVFVRQSMRETHACFAQDCKPSGYHGHPSADSNARSAWFSKKKQSTASLLKSKILTACMVTLRVTIKGFALACLCEAQDCHPKGYHGEKILVFVNFLLRLGEEERALFEM